MLSAKPVDLNYCLETKSQLSIILLCVRLLKLYTYIKLCRGRKQADK